MAQKLYPMKRAQGNIRSQYVLNLIEICSKTEDLDILNSVPPLFNF